MTNDEFETQKKSIDLEEAKARVSKQKIETKLLSFQLTRGFQYRETLKVFASLGGAVAAIVAITGFIFSFYQWNQETAEKRLVRVEERFDKAISKMHAKAPNERLGAITSLVTYLSNGTHEQKKLVLNLLAHSYAIEEDEIVKGAITEVFRGISSYSFSKEILNSALHSLVGISRTLVKKERLEFRRLPTQKVNESLAKSVALSITSLMQAGAKVDSLEGIYCLNCDFSSLNLSNVVFDGAILDSAKFHDSNLEAASFKRADLGGAEFWNANLRKADFSDPITLDDNEFSPYKSYDYLDYRLSHVDMPSYFCSDLSEANFSRRTISGLSDLSGGYMYAGNFSPSSFHGAKLNGTDFSNVKVYVIRKDNKDSSTPIFFAQGMVKGQEQKDRLGRVYFVYEYHLMIDSELNKEASGFAASYRFLASAFYGANWSEAILPKLFKQVIDVYPVDKEVPKDFCSNKLFDWR